MNRQAPKVLPGGGTDAAESKDIRGKIDECMKDYMSKEEIVAHLLDRFSIPPDATNSVWGLMEQQTPGYLKAYYAICENNRKTRELYATTMEDSAMVSKRPTPRWSMDQNAKEQHKQRSLPPAPRLMGTAPKVQRHAAASYQVAQDANAPSTPVKDSAMASKRPRWSMGQNAKERRQQPPLPPAPRLMGTAPNVQTHAAASYEVPQDDANAPHAPIIPMNQQALEAFRIFDKMSAAQFSDYVSRGIIECLKTFMSKEETAVHLLNKLYISPEATNTIWELLHRQHPLTFETYHASCEKNRKFRERYATKVTAPAQITAATTATPVEDSAMASKRNMDQNAKEQHQQRPARRLMGTAPKVQSSAAPSYQVPQDANARHAQSLPVQQISSSAGRPKLQASQEPVSPTTGTPKQILTNLSQIKSSSDQMLKLMTGGHGCRPPSSAAESLQRQRVEQEQVRDDVEQAENLQDRNQQLPHKKRTR